MKVDIKTDTHLLNLVRRIREQLQENNPVRAYHCLQDLEHYLHGRNMDGSEIKR